MASQQEVVQLVATAIDQATPTLVQLRTQIEALQQSATGLSSSTRQTMASAVRQINALTGTVPGMRNVVGGMNQVAGAAGKMASGFSEAAKSLGAELLPYITRSVAAVTAATISIRQFNNQLEKTRDVTRLSEATEVARRTIKGLQAAAEEAGIPIEQMRGMITGLSKDFQDMRSGSGGKLFEGFRNVPFGNARAAMAEMTKLRDLRNRNLINDQQFADRSLDVWAKFIKDLESDVGPAEAARILERNFGQDAAWVRALKGGGITWLQKLADRIKEFDPEAVKAYDKAWRELSLGLSNFSAEVLGPLLPKITKLITLAADMMNAPPGEYWMIDQLREASKELAKFVDNVLPRYFEQAKVLWEEAKKSYEGKPIDWMRVFGLDIFQKDLPDMVKTVLDELADFGNQVFRFWEQFKLKIGKGSQEAFDAARKEELEARRKRRPLPESEEEEYQGLLKKNLPRMRHFDRSKLPTGQDEAAAGLYGPEAQRRALEAMGTPQAPPQTQEQANEEARALEGAAERRARERAERRRLRMRPQSEITPLAPGTIPNIGDLLSGQAQFFAGSGGEADSKFTAPPGGGIMANAPYSTNIEDRRLENENTRATNDLTQEVKKLSETFMRFAGTSFPAGTGGAYGGGEGGVPGGAAAGPGGGGGAQGGAQPMGRLPDYGGTGTRPAPIIPGAPRPTDQFTPGGGNIGPEPFQFTPSPRNSEIMGQAGRDQNQQAQAAQANMQRYIAGIGYLETSFNAREAAKSEAGNTGFYKFNATDARRAMKAGLPDPRAGSLEQQTVATQQYIEKFYPKQAAQIKAGNFEAANASLNKFWVSLPGGSQAQHAKRYAEYNAILAGRSSHEGARVVSGASPEGKPAQTPGQSPIQMAQVRPGEPGAVPAGVFSKEATQLPQFKEQVGALPDQKDRPHRIQGQLQVGEQTFPYATGGAGRGSTPYGTYPVDFQNIGTKGRTVLGSVASVGPGGTIVDPKFPGVPREGIQIHPSSARTLDRLYTQGCFGIPRDQWPAAKTAILAEAAKNPQGLNLTLGRNGMARIAGRQVTPAAPITQLATAPVSPAFAGPGAPAGALPGTLFDPQRFGNIPAESLKRTEAPQPLGYGFSGASLPKEEEPERLGAGFSGAALEPGSLAKKAEPIQVNGSGTIDVNVRAPRGTSVRANGDGMFTKVNMNRRNAEEPAAQGPPAETPALQSMEE